MKQIILDAIKQVKDVSKKEMDKKIILRTISIRSTANLDEDLLKIEIKEISNKGILGKSYRMLNEHGVYNKQKNKCKKKHLLHPGKSTMRALRNIQ